VPRRSFLAVAILSTLCGLAACGSSTPSSSRSASPSGSARPPAVTGTAGAGQAGSSALDPCKLIRPSDVAAAFAGTVGNGVSDIFGGNPVCNFAVKGSNLGADGQVQIIYLRTYTKDTYASHKKEGAAGGDVTVAGVGDDAYYDPKVVGIVFIKKDAVFLVLFDPAGGKALDPEQAKADTVALAQKVVSTI